MDLTMQDIEALRPNHNGHTCDCGEHRLYNRMLKIAGIKPLFTYVYIRGDYDRRHLPTPSEISMWFDTYAAAAEDLEIHVRGYNTAHRPGTPLVVEDYVICRSTASPLYPLDRPGSHTGPLPERDPVNLTDAIGKASRELSITQVPDTEHTDTVTLPRWVVGTLVGAARLHRRERNDR